ncbi:CHASE3 domain-containing protein [Methylocapsa sp. S129]|uniref:CHASE3 domain-containing protein n=1 Tax=Methylocapsa sp. S129 TaxID=1641869 RepID=UPI00131ECA4E|nr:CHASE3 domain-containing protein [Methylocapsa sp. S129]
MPPATPRPLASLYLSLIVAIVLAALLMVATFWLASRAQTEDQQVRHTLAIRDQTNQVLLLVQRLESSQRGYLLTGRDAYLSPFADPAATLPGALDQMAALVADDPRQRPKVEHLRQAAEDKLRELQRVIDERKAGKSDDALAIVNNDSGSRLMDEIRALAADIVSEESRSLESRQNNSETFALLVRLGAAVAFLALCAVGALTSVLTRRSFAEIAASHDRLLVSNHALLEQISRREDVESQLRQAQKMEAIGQLTGGIAHDFNNMLGVVTGSLDLMLRRIQKGDFAIERFAESALKATHRAAALTHRLLAFARQQPLSPEAIDANKMIGAMSDLLRSTLGEQIRIETVTAGGLWTTQADLHQLESAVLNIAINARDAMPDGGKLTIETANAYLDEAYCHEEGNIEPGQYVMVAVTDTGEGMKAEVAARAFDPFFTTKPVGVGTGLGLSQVYGFVKQSKGHIKIYSEVDAGTTVKIYLPRRVGEAGEVKKPLAQEAPVGSVGERILVVEDDASMRRMTVEAIRDLGYAVFESDGAAGALALLADQPITLLLTDIVMPEVNGKKLADEATRRQPDLKVLFMTGYTRNAVVHGGVLDAGVQILGKPFTVQQLAAKLRAALDG